MNNITEIIRKSYENELMKMINQKDGQKIAKPEEIWDNIHRLASEGQSFGEKFYYLSLTVKKMLAFIADPGYRIEYSTVNTESTSTVEARFYWSGQETPAGIGFTKRHISQIFRNDSITNEERLTYLESCARGMAASRAITDAGIGLQFYADSFDSKFEEMERDEAAEAQTRGKAQENAAATTPGTVPEIPSLEEKKTSRLKAAAAKAEASAKKADTEKNEPVNTQPEVPTASPTEETTPVPKEDATTVAYDLESAKAVICDMGSYADNPLGTIYESNPRNLIWLINNGSKVADAARVIVESDPELKAYLN